MDIGNAMMEIREQAGISRPEMAAKLGITRQAMWKIETGRCWPKQKVIEKFCEISRTPLGYLYVKAITIEDYYWPAEAWTEDGKLIFKTTFGVVPKKGLE